MPKNFKTLRENPPANFAGDPSTTNIAGLGIGEKEPGVKGKKPPVLRRRKKFAGCEVFEVDADRYNRCRVIKQSYERYSKYVGDDELGQTIREYARKNPGKSIIVQDESTGSMTYLKIGQRKVR